jgi:hypothetical protein
MFEGWDAVVLAPGAVRITMSYILFPAFSIGLASYLAVLEALRLWTGREVFINLFNYWLKIFAVAFGMGVVSGIVMSYQFGTNWSASTDKSGPLIGPLMAYEVLAAFFLEAGFLGVMLFGRERVGGDYIVRPETMDRAEMRSSACPPEWKDEKRKHSSEIFWLLAFVPSLRFDAGSDLANGNQRPATLNHRAMRRD